MRPSDEIVVTGRGDEDKFRVTGAPLFQRPPEPLSFDLGGGVKLDPDTKQGRLGDAQLGIAIKIPF